MTSDHMSIILGHFAKAAPIFEVGAAKTIPFETPAWESLWALCVVTRCALERPQEMLF